MDKRLPEIDRRRFLKFVSAGLAAGGLTGLAGCGSEPTTSAPAATATMSPTATAVPPTATEALRRIRYGVSEPQGPKETTDPAFGTSVTDAKRISCIYDQLVELDDGFAPHPMLAESWEKNDSADVWTFKLREDATFHDGTELTAADVVYTYQRILDPETGSGGAALMSGIDPDGIEALDDYTVRFNLPQPIVELPVTINNRFVHVVKEGATEEDLRTGGIGTGPFKVEEFQPGEALTVLVKNEDYWREGRPKVDVLEFRSIVESSARVAALERGQVEVIEDVPWSALGSLEDNPDLDVVSHRNGFWSGFVMWCDTPPYDDVRVRKALKYCIDREEMLDLVIQGQGNVGNDVPVPDWQRYSLEGPARERDIEKAKELLAEAGYPNGIDLELHTAEVLPYWVDLATVLKEMAAEAGINIEIKMTPADSFWGEVWLKKPFSSVYWGARPTSSALSVMYMSDADWNDTHWYRPEWDELMKEASQTVDDEQRKALYQEAQRMIVEEGGHLIPFFVNSVIGTTANVAGYTPPPRVTVYDFSTIELKA